MCGQGGNERQQEQSAHRRIPGDDEGGASSRAGAGAAAQRVSVRDSPDRIARGCGNRVRPAERVESRATMIRNPESLGRWLQGHG
jgi:hypothetical protein